jgi:hypothetical protein
MRACSRPGRLIARVALAGAALIFFSPSAASAQDAPADRPGRVFAGGSLLGWSARGAEADPEGYGTHRPHFHGGLDWPAPGILVNAGVHIAHDASLGVEIAWRREQSAAILEQSRSHFEFRDVHSRLSDSERIVSFVVRWHMRPTRATDVQPLAGLSFSSHTRSLTGRSGIYTWFGGTLPISRPDEEVRATSRGFVAGADLVLRADRPAAIALGARVHAVRTLEYNGLVPARDPYALLLTAGVRWQSLRGSGR